MYVAHASEVPESGDYVLRQIGRQPVIVSRDEDGQVHPLLNRCRHRAALADPGCENLQAHLPRSAGAGKSGAGPA